MAVRHRNKIWYANDEENRSQRMIYMHTYVRVRRKSGKMIVVKNFCTIVLQY